MLDLMSGYDTCRGKRERGREGERERRRDDFMHEHTKIQSISFHAMGEV